MKRKEEVLGTDVVVRFAWFNVVIPAGVGVSYYYMTSVLAEGRGLCYSYYTVTLTIATFSYLFLSPPKDNTYR